MIAGTAFRGSARRPARVALLLGALLLATASGAGAEAFLGATRSVEDGTVMVELTPRAYQDGRLEVSIAVNTHTANDLDRYRLERITVLEAGGKEYHPSSAPALRGHHSRGKLVFEVPALRPPFAIRIENLHDAGVKRFTW